MRADRWRVRGNVCGRAWSAVALGVASIAVVALGTGLAPLAQAAQSAAVQPPALPLAAPGHDCAAVAQTPWPLTASGRARLLARAEDLRDACIDNAAFLALLGALWLEQGEAGQALLWLERSLMLEPDVPATLADHALALAAMGERTAAVELLRRWRDRPDVPPALRARLEAAAQSGTVMASGAGSRTAAVGARSGLSWRRTVSLLHGHESNLDRSPRLSEITLSSPDGPIDLPLAVPIVPRAGSAQVADASLQALYSSGPGALWQGGVHFSIRHSPQEPDTDTRQTQLALARWTQHDGWRSQFQAAAQRVAGRLNQAFYTYTLGVAAEREWNGCWSRLGLDAEWRRQDYSEVVDSQTSALQTGLNCKLYAWPGWAGGIALRLGIDRPRMVERPGGVQLQGSLGLRASGPLGAGFRLEASTRFTVLQDKRGYSALLENDAQRRQTQQHVSLEVSRPLPGLFVSGLDLVLQLHALRQHSNIKLFENSGRSGFAGLRLDW